MGEGERRKLKKRRDNQCREETEQDREARALEQVVEWAEAKAGRAEAAGVVSERGREAIAFVPAAVKRRPTSWERPAMTSSVPNAGHP